MHKDPHWLWETMDKWLKTSKTKLAGAVPDICKPIVDADLQVEAKWLRKVLTRVNSPVMFCHNDMQEGNILLYNNNDKENNNNEEPRLVLIGRCFKR